MKARREPLISISLGRRHVIFAATFIAILSAIGYAIAIGSGDFNIHGHDTGELSTCPDGQILKMSGGAWACADDNIGTQFSPSTYNGQQSVTYPNGMIFKQGQGETSPGRVDFTTPFPTAIISISLTPIYNNGVADVVVKAGTQSVDGFNVLVNGVLMDYYWQAWGY